MVFGRYLIERHADIVCNSARRPKENGGLYDVSLRPVSTTGIQQVVVAPAPVYSGG